MAATQLTGKQIKDTTIDIVDINASGTPGASNYLRGDGTWSALDADLTSWAGVTRASGFDTFATTPTSANLDALVTDDTGSGALVFATSPTLVTPVLGVAIATSMDVAGVVRSTSSSVPAAGAGIELIYSTPRGYLQAYDRTGSAYKEFAMEASAAIINPNSGGTAGVGAFGVSNLPTNTWHVVGTSGTPSLRIGSTNLNYYWDLGRENASTGDFVLLTHENVASTEAMRVTTTKNLLIGGVTAAGTSAVGVLGIGNSTVPSTSPADMIQIFSVDLSAGNATLGLRTETAVVTESVVSDRTLSVKINGTTYKICLKA
jgi:hypothetical protein